MKLVTHLRKICNHSNARLVVCSAQFSVPTGPVNFLRPLNVKWETGNDNPILARNSCPGNLWSQFPIGKNHLPLNCRGMASSICSKLALLENFWTFIALRQIGATCLQSEILPRPLSKFASFRTLCAIRSRSDLFTTKWRRTDAQFPPISEMAFENEVARNCEARGA